MRDVTIRDMAASDVERVVAIIAEHHDIDGKLARAYYAGYFGDESRMRSPRENNYVATLDGRVVGVAGYGPDKYDWPDIVWLTWLYLSVEFRGRGIGAHMLKTVLDTAKSIGTRKVYLDTGSDSSYEAAVKLYRGFGFKIEGRLTDYYEPGEDCLILGLSL